MVVVWAGWLKRLEGGRVSLSVGGSHSRGAGVEEEGAGVEGRAGVERGTGAGAGVKAGEIIWVETGVHFG